MIWPIVIERIFDSYFYEDFEFMDPVGTFRKQDPTKMLRTQTENSFYFNTKTLNILKPKNTRDSRTKIKNINLIDIIPRVHEYLYF